MSCLSAMSLSPRSLIEKNDCLVNDHISRLLESLAIPCNVGRDRRGRQRFPFPKLIHVTPISPTGLLLEDETIVVVGKSISRDGIGFFHQQPFAHRRAVVLLPTSPDQWLGIVTDVSWCRFTRYGWYESGGHFLEVVEVPLAG